MAGVGLAAGVGLLALALPQVVSGVGGSAATGGAATGGRAGVLTRIDGAALATRFPKAEATYAAPEGFARHVSAQGMVWHTLPQAPETAHPAAIVLLHGSGRDGRAMIDMWQGVAADHDLLLIAPDAADPERWTAQTESAAALRLLLDEVAQTHPFDPERVYLYGHSAGANHALALAEDGPWRAVAVHAGAVGEVRAASGDGVPVRIQIGTDDVLFPLDTVTAAAERLAEAGHAVDLLVIPGHDHWFYDIGPRLAVDAWSFFEHAAPLAR